VIRLTLAGSNLVRLAASSESDELEDELRPLLRPLRFFRPLAPFLFSGSTIERLTVWRQHWEHEGTVVCRFFDTQRLSRILLKFFSQIFKYI